MRLPILALALSLPAAAMAQDAMMNVTYACANDRTLQASFINAGDESFAVIFEAGALVPMVPEGLVLLTARAKRAVWEMSPWGLPKNKHAISQGGLCPPIYSSHQIIRFASQSLDKLYDQVAKATPFIKYVR